MEYIIGIDIGGTKTAISLAGTGSDIPQIVDGIRFETPKSGYASTLQSIIDNCYKLLDNNGILTENLRAVGICCGGPLDAENGLGWGASKIRCLGLCSMDFFILAGRPQRINTMGRSCSPRIRMAASVNSSQPIFRWELAAWARTVSTVFRSRTPCLAHFSR